jgi:hypothetical protein
VIYPLSMFLCNVCHNMHVFTQSAKRPTVTHDAAFTWMMVGHVSARTPIGVGIECASVTAMTPPGRTYSWAGRHQFVSCVRSGVVWFAKCKAGVVGILVRARAYALLC